jgi:hypothetical protein
MALTFADLPLHEREAAVAALVADWVRELRWACRHGVYPVTTHTPIAAIRALLRHELPSLDVIGTIAGWILFQTDWDAKRRPLTDSELTVRAAADRISRAVVAARHSQETT